MDNDELREDVCQSFLNLSLEENIDIDQLLEESIEENMGNDQLLKDVSQSFLELKMKYPDIIPYLENCFEKIKQKFTGGKTPPRKEDQKEKMKTLLTSSIDMENLFVDYSDLTSRTHRDVAELVDLLKKLNQAGASTKKKATQFAARQGFFLKTAKENLSRDDYKKVWESCGFKKRYVYFLISLSSLFELYPKLQCCAVPIRAFMANLPVIKEIYEEDRIFWNNIY